VPLVVITRFMKRAFVLLLLAAAAGPATPAPGEAALPLVEGVDAKALYDHCQRIVKFLDAHQESFPADTLQNLRDLLPSKPDLPADFAERAQKLLDAHCLVGVTINPESRVKATRGPAAARLTLDRPRLVLIKVINEAGVTHALTVASPQFRTTKHKDGGRWLEAALQTARPLQQTLAGQKVEYAVLQLTAREAGRREAVLIFDVGQGTQDLGFRAEVPVLFSVQAAVR
jgi:hypothetical protein